MILVRFAAHLDEFEGFPNLRCRVGTVLSRLPAEVQMDFAEDPAFRIALEDTSAGQGWKLFMACPSPASPVSRCVVLRRRLDTASEAFAMYVIAHEFAHAYLRNGGWGAIQDIEEAADALAASWGFPRPSGW